MRVERTFCDFVNQTVLVSVLDSVSRVFHALESWVCYTFGGVLANHRRFAVLDGARDARS